jgi:flagellar assembly protein FliH
MSAAPAKAPETALDALTPEDLLALVRRSAGKFQRHMPGAPEAEAGGFAPLSFVRAPEPEAAPQEPAPEPAPEPDAHPDTGFTPAPAPQPIDIEAERRAAWAEGHAEALREIETARAEAREAALDEARSTAAEEVAEARDIFTAAVTRLTTAEHDRAEALTARLEQAVRLLAAERAGQKIDEAPRPFLRKIEKMTREIAAGCDSTVVRMNAADLVAIKPHIKGFSPLAKARLAPDTTLGRGDIRIVMDDITFSDVIAERSAGGLA